MHGYIFFVLVAVFIAIMFRLMHGGMDRNRITRYIESRRGRLIDANWMLFGPGWAGKGKARIYEVRYIDKDGNQHRAFCKTSGWSGVYFTEDRIEQSVDAPKAQDSLEEENRRLHDELD